MMRYARTILDGPSALIISHRHKFIFFAVPKTATHTIREALRPHLGPDDWEQQVLFAETSLPFPEIAALRHGHIGATEIAPHLDADIWRDYFKFGFVRNPFDRFISTCFFFNRDNPNFAASAMAFMKERLSRRRFQQRVLVRPQHLQLCGSDGEIALDFVGRYENLQQSYDTICERLGLPSTELGRKNESKHSRYVDYYQDDDLRKQVADFYAEDLRRFAYDMPSGATDEV
jgi:hypothetical protein